MTEWKYCTCISGRTSSIHLKGKYTEDEVKFQTKRSMLIFNIQLPLIWLCACFFPVNILKSGHFRLEGVGGDQHVVGVSLIPFTSALHFLQRGLQHEGTTQTNSEIARDTRNCYRFRGLYTCILLLHEDQHWLRDVTSALLTTYSRNNY